ncbi:MAG TPA: D-glycerate dehydrogenase [Rhodospirillales bacterium]|nr:D-glycerate dehydrogenase [Rhodospirillales bacterium]
MSEQKKILITRRVPEAVTKRALESYRATINGDDNAYGNDELLARCAGMDGLLCTITNQINRDLIMALPGSVRVIATFSVGFEHIDLDAANERGIMVTNTPGVLTAATADIAMLLMLGAARRAAEGTRMIAEGWTGWTPTQLMGIEITGKRLGIVGMGDIGRAVALRARAFGMEIHYHNRQPLAADLEIGAVYHESLESLLPVSDFLSLHCPLNDQTRHLLNAGRITLLPDRPVVINTARGPVVDDGALIAALKSGRVAAAGLDVFEGEPNIAPGYLDCPTAFLLPHLGSATLETRNAMGFKALDNLDAFFAGTEPPNRIA